MKKEIINEIVVAIILVLLIVAFLDPFHYWMPGPLAMFLLFLALLVFLIFAVFIWREKVHDEREDYHRLWTGRLAWLVGAAFLMVGIIVQEINHTLDHWLVYALLVMVITKLLSLIYLKNKF